MAKKTKWNYAVVKSMFGDYWIGKTKLSTRKGSIFSDLEYAIQEAEMLFEDTHFGFDPNDESNDNDELLCRYEDIRNNVEESIEIITKDVEKFIV